MDMRAGGLGNGFGVVSGSLGSWGPPGFYGRAALVNLHSDAESVNEAIDSFLSKINFQTEEEARAPENVPKVKQAFIEFFHEAGLPLSELSFENLLGEKIREFEFRADGVTPNWYHELREVLLVLSLIRTGKLPLQVINSVGGLDALISGVLRHDSWEDFGKTPLRIYAALEKAFNDWSDKIYIDEEELLLLQKRAARISQMVDLATRKVPVIGEFGEILFTPKGKILKVDRFPNLDIYHEKQLPDPFAILNKYVDSVEGMSTRPGVGRFDIDDNIKYAKERRELYTDRELKAADHWPGFKDAFCAVDSMLGVTLKILETVNEHYKNPSSLIANRRPIDISKYLPDAADAFAPLPPAFRSDMIMIRRLENMARRELALGDMRMACILEHEIYPSMIPMIGDRRGTCLNEGHDSGYHL